MGPSMAAVRGALGLAAAFASAALLPACGSCDNASLTPGRFTLSVDKPALEMGNVFIGASKEQTLTLHAEGSLAIAYASTFDGDAFGFEAGPAFGALAPNGNVQIHVKFRPGRQGL